MATLFKAVLFATVTLLLGAGAVSSGMHSVLQFDSALIQQGQIYRLVSVWFVHNGWLHLVGNVGAALTLLWLWPLSSARQLGTWFLVSVLGSILALGHTAPVVGASGAIHAIFVYCALTQGLGMQANSRWVRVLLVSGVATKVALEMGHVVDVTGVAWQVHLSGLFAGLLVGCISLVQGASPVARHGVLPKELYADQKNFCDQSQGRC